MTAGPRVHRDHPSLTQDGLSCGSRVESATPRRRWWRSLLLVAGGTLLLLACAPAPIFPPDIMQKADRSLTFKEVIAHPADYEGRVVEFGGEILGSLVEGEEVQLLVRELPIHTTPIYGPVDPGGFRGMFVIRFTGKVGAQDIQSSNVIAVIGTMIGAVVTTVTGVPVSRPTVRADCFHIWRTQGNPLDDFPWINNARYWRLIEQTYCVNQENTILNVT